MTYAVLQHTAGRFEVKSAGVAIGRVAAGWSDARALAVEWIPIVVTPAAGVRLHPAGPASVDVCFVGNLSYPPNVEALGVLGSAWPAVQRAVPEASALVAGANPTSNVLGLAHRHRWSLLPNFAEVSEVYARARLAVSPLLTASGIQIKVLEAAAYAVPQIVLPPAIAGFEPGFPVRVAQDPSSLSEEIVNAIRNPAAAAEQGALAATVVRQRYSAAAWAPVVRELLDFRSFEALGTG